jgi:murein DD-endopeptidase MepM/ murein hydrolase activator NlpD
MKNTSVILLILLMLSASVSIQAQEKGLFKKNPKIKPNVSSKTNTNFPEPPAPKDEFESYQKEAGKMKFANQFEPAKEQNPVIQEDTTTIQEGKITVVEQVDSVQIGDDWVQAAHYYVVWDSRNIDPYNLSPTEFKESINIKLFDPEQDQTWNLPLVKTKITSHFGPRWGRWHEGMDIDAETGDPVMTTFDGVVRIVGVDGRGYGNFVLVRHYNGLETLYGHLSKQKVEPGDMVKAGDTIGLAGNTGRSFGDHLHYENRYEGNAFSPAWIWDFPQESIVGQTFLLTPKVWDHLRGGAAYQGEFDSSKSKLKHTVMHRVQRGETIETIALQYSMTVEELAKINKIQIDSPLRPGLQLRIK